MTLPPADARGKLLGFPAISRAAVIALLMGRFYEGLLTGNDPATALHDAQQWLRGLDRDGARTAYGLLRESVATRADVDPGAVAERRIAPVGRPAGAARRPVGYAHPRHWAAFALVGR